MLGTGKDLVERKHGAEDRVDCKRSAYLAALAAVVHWLSLLRLAYPMGRRGVCDPLLGFIQLGERPHIVSVLEGIAR